MSMENGLTSGVWEDTKTVLIMSEIGARRWVTCDSVVWERSRSRLSSHIDGRTGKSSKYRLTFLSCVEQSFRSMLIMVVCESMAEIVPLRHPCQRWRNQTFFRTAKDDTGTMLSSSFLKLWQWNHEHKGCLFPHIWIIKALCVPSSADFCQAISSIWIYPRSDCSTEGHSRCAVQTSNLLWQPPKKTLSSRNGS